MIVHRKFSYLLVAVFTTLSLLLSGCLSMADDITPPPDQSPPGTAAGMPTQARPEPTAEPESEQEASEPAPPSDDEEGTVSVDILDGTGGLILDDDLEIYLEGYDEFDQVYQDMLEVPENGQVRFQGVPFEVGRVFFASIPFGGAIYRSEIVQVEQGTTTLDLQIQIFETTTDTSGLIIDRLHVLVDFPQPELVQIVEIYILSNLGSETIVAESPDQPSVEFSLPDGAGSIQFEDGSLGQRFTLTDDGFGDSVSIPPGTGVYQVLVSYTLPYGRNRIDFDQPMNFPLSAGVVMVPAADVELRGAGLEDMGVQSLPGSEVRVYSAGNISRGDSLAFRISGSPGSPGSGILSGLDLNQVIVYGAGIAGAALLVAGIWLYFRNRRSEVDAEPEQESNLSREEILDSIIALEDLYQNGEISQQVFEKKRGQLKDQLRVASGAEEE